MTTKCPSLELKIQSDKTICAVYRGHHCQYDPGDALGWIYPSTHHPGKWWWSGAEGRDNVADPSDTIEAALEDFCQHAFDQPITL